jgi:hypothetical protein
VCDQRFETIQPAKRPLDTDLVLNESCHALSSEMALDFYIGDRARPIQKEALTQW